MLPASTILRKCSACSHYMKEYSLLSGNTIGARYWTDGKRKAPMLPEYPLLVKCPHCGVVVWIKEMEEIGRGFKFKYREKLPDFWHPIQRYKELQRRKNLKSPEDLTIDEYYLHLETVPVEKDREIYVRMHLWWKENDPRRVQNSDVMLELEERQRENMELLEAMLDESIDENRIMKAEIQRELGNFEKALMYLDFSFPVELEVAVETIRRLAKARESCVKELIQ